MEQLDFEDFKKLDLRVGEIKEVKDHPNADKLYVLSVDIGEEMREIVAGMRHYYKREELIGKKIIIVANLKPVMLRGVKSNGMLLAAQKGEKVVLLEPGKDIGNGAKVS